MLALRFAVTTLGLFGAATGALLLGQTTTPPAHASTTAGTSPGYADRCAQLIAKQVAGATIDRAEYIPAGGRLQGFEDKLAAGVCTVDARISPVAGSLIKMRIWLPDNWNEKFFGVGGAGFNGGLKDSPMTGRAAINRGFATVATDAGHDLSGEPEWAMGSREKIVDFAHRANHLGAVVGKALAAQHYGKPVRRAYFHGCSNGGRDALMLAQRYPGDYDAIASGAPANDWTGLMASFMRSTQVSHLSPGSDILGPKMKLLNEAVLDKCDALDGLKDKLIANPAACRFDPAVLQCKGATGATCLSKAEVTAVTAVYRGYRTRGGKLIMPGFPLGSEYLWSAGITSPGGTAPQLGQMYHRYFLYRDPSWTVAQFALDRDYALSQSRFGALMNATDPDLRPFIARGGKLLIYHGWDDTAIPAGNSIRYYASVQRKLGKRAGDNVRLFMLPGVAHCLTGRGPDNIDFIGELERWSDGGAAPDRIIATKYDNPFRAFAGLSAKVMRTRPACAWPKAAQYSGQGSIDDAASFICR